MVFYQLDKLHDASPAQETERKFVALLEKLDRSLVTNPRGLDCCSFPRRITHLSSNEIQESITLTRGPEAERLQLVYARLKIGALKVGHPITVSRMQEFTIPENTDLRPVVRQAVAWIDNRSTQNSFKDFFTTDLLPTFAKYLHFMRETSGKESFSSNSFVQTILHVQQKFFIVDSLATSPADGLTAVEQQKLQGLLTKSLRGNLIDFLQGLEI